VYACVICGRIEADTGAPHTGFEKMLCMTVKPACNAAASADAFIGPGA
jgi:hypothetical protein